MGDRRHRGRAAWAFFLFILITFLMLNLPDHPDAITFQNFLRIPLEIFVLPLILLVAPTRIKGLLIWLAVLAGGLILFLKLADIGTQASFQRQFNPYLDGKMMVDGWNLMSGSVGKAASLGVCAIVLLAFFALLFVYRRSMRAMTDLSSRRRRTALLFSCVLTALGAVALAVPQRLSGVPVELRAATYLADRLVLIGKSVADLRRFETDVAAPDPVAAENPLFEAVEGRDVILIFVESYGRSAIEDPRYSGIIGPRLAAMTHELQDKGFSTASRWITSPTVSGLSWLAHGTFLSGLWIDSQARYDRLTTSQRQSLNRAFGQAGWDSVAVMPAITMNWPEAGFYGYDRILVAKHLGYKGKPFNWITMPDQYTLAAFQRMVRDPVGRKPVMAEIALVSSHAPWTPVPHLIDWNAVGDGTIFNGQATSDDPPATVWADPDQVRRHYIATVDYSLQTLSSYIARYGDNALFLVLGDHQPAPIVTGADASRAVPLHVVSRNKALVEKFIAAGFSSGMVPARDAAEVPMSDMRATIARLLR